MAGISYYTATINSDGSGDGTNLDANGIPAWSGDFNGFLYGVRLEYGGTPDAGTDVTIAEPLGLERTVLSISNNNTDTSYNPQSQIQTNAGVNTGVYFPFLVDSSNLKVTLAQAVISTTAALVVTVGIME